MGMMTCPEVRESFLTHLERAKLHDEQVRDFDRRFTDWVSIASVCVAIDRDREWEILGFNSFGQWIVNAAPRSRAYLYLVMGRYRELVADIPEEELREIPLGSAGVLKQLSSAVRKSSKIRQAAKQKPSELRQVIAEYYPLQHIEGIVEQRLRFTTSQWQRIEAAYEAYRTVDALASLETFIEWLVSETQ